MQNSKKIYNHYSQWNPIFWLNLINSEDFLEIGFIKILQIKEQWLLSIERARLCISAEEKIHAKRFFMRRIGLLFQWKWVKYAYFYGIFYGNLSCPEHKYLKVWYKEKRCMVSLLRKQLYTNMPIIGDRAGCMPRPHIRTSMAQAMAG